MAGILMAKQDMRRRRVVAVLLGLTFCSRIAGQWELQEQEDESLVSVTAASPQHLQVLCGDSAVVLRCEFDGSPPSDGTFALGINGRVAYLTADPEIETTLPAMVTGMWHSVHCLVLDASGRAILSSNNTFMVRPGSDTRADDVSDVMGNTSVLWAQHHDSCSVDETHPLHDAANRSRQNEVAKRTWEWCPSALDTGAFCGAKGGEARGCEVEGLVDKDTHYPPHAAKLLEEHFYHFYVSNAEHFPAGIEYVPVMWISHMHNLQLHRFTYRPTEDDLVAHILDRYSDPSKRYFAVMQADYWPEKLEAAIPTNWLVFSASCVSPSAWPIPLTTQFHPSPPAHLPPEGHSKNYLASFIGRDTTWVRLRLRELLSHDPDFLIITDSFMIDVSNQQAFRHVTAESLFVLSPRGNGATSFRIFEALEHFSIPVYIHDDACCLPMSDVIDWHEFAVLVPASELAFLPDLLRSYSPADIQRMLRRGQEVVKEFFSLNGACRYVQASLLEAERRWEDPHLPPVPPALSEGCQASAVGRAIRRLVTKMHKASDDEEGSAGGLGAGRMPADDGGDVTTSEMAAVARMILRRCLASSFRDGSCADVSFLLERATAAADGPGSARAGHSSSLAASHGEAAALLDASFDQAIVLALQALAVNVKEHRAWQLLRWLLGPLSAASVQFLARRLADDDSSVGSPAARGNVLEALEKELQTHGSNGEACKDAGKEAGGSAETEASRRRRYCLAPLDVGWGEGEGSAGDGGGAVVAWIELWHLLVACRWIEGHEGGRGGNSWHGMGKTSAQKTEGERDTETPRPQRTVVVPSWMEGLVARWRGPEEERQSDGGSRRVDQGWRAGKIALEGGEWLREESQRAWLSTERMRGSFVWHSAAFGGGNQGIEVYEGIMIDWATFTPALPLHHVRRHITDQSALRGEDLARMVAPCSKDVVAFDALPRMADLDTLHCIAGWFPAFDEPFREGDVGARRTCAQREGSAVLERGWNGGHPEVVSDVLRQVQQDMRGGDKGRRGGWGDVGEEPAAGANGGREGGVLLLIWDDSVGMPPHSAVEGRLADRNFREDGRERSVGKDEGEQGEARLAARGASGHGSRVDVCWRDVILDAWESCSARARDGGSGELHTASLLVLSVGRAQAQRRTSAGVGLRAGDAHGEVDEGVVSTLEREMEALGVGATVNNLGYVDASQPEGLLELLRYVREADLVVAPRGSAATLAILLAEPLPAGSDAGGAVGSGVAAKVAVFVC